MLKQLWKDESGAAVSAELLLVATILVLGLVVGIKSVRDTVLSEVADLAQSIANFDQTYSLSGISGHYTSASGFEFIDAVDFCDTPGFALPPGNEQRSKCVNVTVGAASEAP